MPEAWSPDGPFLLYREDKHGLKVFDIEARQSRQLHAEVGDDGWSEASWSPDGTFLAVTKRSSRSERLAWEGVTAEAVARLVQARR